MPSREGAVALLAAKTRGYQSSNSKPFLSKGRVRNLLTSGPEKKDGKLEMILQKLRATQTYIDPRYPISQKIPLNPDGFEAADYIQNMIEHMGQIIKIALDGIEDEQARKRIETHAHAAIKGVQNESEAGNLLGSARAKMV